METLSGDIATVSSKSSFVKERSDRSWRSEFPIFTERASALHYLDSAATTQKPRSVLAAMDSFYLTQYSNIHRGAYDLSAQATTSYEYARSRVASFLKARVPEEIVFTRGTTDSLNLIAQMLRPKLSAGDKILLTQLEHHSNIVPWQLLAKQVGAAIEYVAINRDGTLNLDSMKRILSAGKVKIFGVTALSNVLGTVTPIAEIASIARQYGALVVVDAAQAVAHIKCDVTAWGCDFLAFSGHKLYGPTGIGALYGKLELLQDLDPVFGGGGMISSVEEQVSTWASVPHRFEPGTPPICEAIGLGAAVDYVSSLGFGEITSHEEELLKMLFSELGAIPGVRLLGPGANGDLAHQRAVCSFSVEGIHPHDIATVADTEGVQIRAGHHCALPLMRALGVQSTCRASLGVYSVPEDIERLSFAIKTAQKQFS